MAAAAHHLDRDKLTGPGAVFMAGLNLQLTTRLFVDRRDPGTLALGVTEDAEHAGAARGELPDDAAMVSDLWILGGLDPRQHAIADRCRLRLFQRSFRQLRDDED